MLRLLRRTTLAVLLAMPATCCGSSPPAGDGDSAPENVDAASSPEGDSGATPDDSGTTPPPPPPDGEWFESPRSSAQLFATGHSLIDGVFGPPARDGGPIAGIASEAGKTHGSELQAGPGSTAWRRHQDIESGAYPTPRWASFDTLVLTERADLAGSIVWENGLREMGWFVEQIATAPPGGDELFLYQTWPGYDDGGAMNLRTWDAWIDYVRTETTLFECTAERLGRPRGVRMHVLPAGTALAELVAAIQAGTAEGLSIGDVFEDEIHLTDLGDAYIAMVAFASIYRTPSTGRSVPGVSGARAAYFAGMVDRVVSQYYAGYEAPTSAQCVTVMADMCRRGGLNWGCNPEDHFGAAVYGD